MLFARIEYDASSVIFFALPRSMPMTDLNLNHCLEVAEDAARQAGAVLLDWQGRFETREKGPNDFVTDADFASQKVLEAALLGAFPTHGFLGEEDTGHSAAGGSLLSQPGPLWCVDPLDGTANYVHKLQTYAVSIALLVDGRPAVGVIFDPVLNELYSAIRGQGAWLNGKPLRVRNCQSAAEAMVAVSFSNVLTRDSVEITRFIEVLLTCRSVRRLGSAALNLAYLAAGRLDAYYASSVKAWDIAAGVLLVQEAGGMVTHMHGGPLELQKPAFLAVSTAELHSQMLPWMSHKQV